MRYVPGGRFTAVKLPVSDETTSAATFVPALITLIATPGTAAFDESMTTPVMVPRSVCADAANGTARTRAAMNDALKRVKLMVPPPECE